MRARSTRRDGTKLVTAHQRMAEASATLVRWRSGRQSAGARHARPPGWINADAYQRQDNLTTRCFAQRGPGQRNLP